MSDILSAYKAPYSDILYTNKQVILEDALRPISQGFRLYDESKLMNRAIVDRLRKILRDDHSHEIVLYRNILKEDKTHLIPEIPEAWWWVFLWRLLWQFHWEPDPWFEIKWWKWLEMRGKRQALNMAGCQNCLGRNVSVMMAGGTTKKSQHIRVGDLLMGPDGEPREVLILHQGRSELFAIIPETGPSWVCTGNHRLELEDERGHRIKIEAENLHRQPKDSDWDECWQVSRSPDGSTWRTPIEVRKWLHEGDFFGWTVDKDNMFLLGSGCITNNSGKSMFGGTFPLIQLIVWEQKCKAYLSGPYKTHTDDKLWGELKTQLILQKTVGVSLEALFNFDIKDNKNEITIETDRGTGLIKFVASQEAASVVGSKTKDHKDTTGRDGISLFIVDEYVENVNTDIERAFGNFRSNYNSIMALMCNPNPVTALHPNVVAFIDPLDKKRGEMRKTVDYCWRTRKGQVIRFDWSNCPNRLLDQNRWPHLMNALRAESQSMESDDNRAGQLDAWPFGAEGANSLTDPQRQMAAGVFSDFHYETAPEMRILALDPAFGGDDPAVYTILDVAKVSVMGQIRTRFIGVEQGYIEGIDSGFIADHDFVQKCEEVAAYREARGDRETKFLREIRPGSSVGPMAQGAVLAAHLCIAKGVKFDCFTFDASQRADCYDWILKVFGHQNLVWWYEGSRRLISEEGDDWFRWPYRTRDEKQGGSRFEKWSDYCGRVITMVWAFSCELINNGYLIGGSAVQKSLNELGAREVASTSSGKCDVWSKQDIKRGTFQGKKIPKMQSPAWGETLAMALYFGARFKNAVELGERPELSHHFGQSQDHWEDWLELHDKMPKKGFTFR